MIRLAGRKTLKSLGGMVLLGMLAGCADEYVVLNSVTGDPLIISRRAYTSDNCIAKVKEDASQIGVPLRFVHVKGTTFGRSLLWPFEPGFACEAAIGPEERPSGAYPIGSYLKLQRS